MFVQLFGRYLVKENAISSEAYEKIVEKMASVRAKLGVIAIAEGMITKEQAEEINKLARFLNCQFIIATHSPFMLGTLNARIYNIDTDDYRVVKWSQLENVRYFYEFFKKHEDEFK